MNLKLRFAVMMIAACAVAFSACDSDEPITDPETPETPVDPVEPEEPDEPDEPDEPEKPGEPDEPDEPEFPDGPAEPLPDEIRPMLTDSKSWSWRNVWHYYDSEWYGSERNIYHTTFIAGNTTINGVPAKTMMKQREGDTPNEIPSMHEEKDGVVSKLWDTTTFDEYDEPTTNYVFKYCFEIDPQSSEIPNYEDGFHTITVLSKGTIALMGKTRRAALVKCDRKYHVMYDYWVESIGPLFGLTVRHDETLPSTSLYNWLPMYTQLLECYENGVKIYDYREFTPERYNPETIFVNTNEDINEVVRKMMNLEYTIN